LTGGRSFFWAWGQSSGWCRTSYGTGPDGCTGTSTVLSVRRPEPDPHPDPTADQGDGRVITVTVELALTETVMYAFQSETEIPADVVGDEDELHGYLDELSGTEVTAGPVSGPGCSCHATGTGVSATASG
jgi:hypothetical protein